MIHDAGLQNGIKNADMSCCFSAVAAQLLFCSWAPPAVLPYRLNYSHSLSSQLVFMSLTKRLLLWLDHGSGDDPVWTKPYYSCWTDGLTFTLRYFGFQSRIWSTEILPGAHIITFPPPCLTAGLGWLDCFKHGSLHPGPTSPIWSPLSKKSCPAAVLFSFNHSQQPYWFRVMTSDLLTEACRVINGVLGFLLISLSLD